MEQHQKLNKDRGQTTRKRNCTRLSHLLTKDILPQLFAVRPKTVPSSLLNMNVPKSDIFCRNPPFCGPPETTVVAPVLAWDAIFAE